MPFSHLPASLVTVFSRMAHRPHERSAARLPLLLYGVLLAKGQRTVTSWFRAAAITDDFRCADDTVCATGCRTQDVAISVLQTVRPLLGPRGTHAAPAARRRLPPPLH